MQRIEFNRGRMLLAAAFFAFCLVFLISIFFSPETVSNRGFLRLIGSDAGRTIFLPMLVISCMVLLWRSFWLALFSPTALEFTPSHLRVNTFWGWQDIQWNQVSRAWIEMFNKQPQLRVETLGRKKLRLPLGATNLGEGQAGELLHAIRQRART